MDKHYANVCDILWSPVVPFSIRQHLIYLFKKFFVHHLQPFFLFLFLPLLPIYFQQMSLLPTINPYLNLSPGEIILKKKEAKKQREEVVKSETEVDKESPSQRKDI